MSVAHNALNLEVNPLDRPGRVFDPSSETLVSPCNSLYEQLEKPNWAPWLRFGPEVLARQAEIFPEGQIIIPDEMGEPIVALSANRVQWSGNADHLTSWDRVAGADQTYADTHDPKGNTFVLMSMSANPNYRGRGLSGHVFTSLRGYAEREKLDHIIGDFRPRDFGAYKRETGNFDFNAYCQLQREDGTPHDGWLRTVSRHGTEFLKVDRRAMVVRATATEVAEWQAEYKPEAWWQVEDPEQIDYLMQFHEPLRELEHVDAVLECGETGTWYLDRQNNKAVYIESNLWGEVPTGRPTTEATMAVTLEMPAHARYDLPAEQVRELESQLVGAVKQAEPEPNLYVTWIGPNNRYADAVRTLEAAQFPEVPDLVNDDIEQRSLFMAIVDTRDGEDRIVHAARLSGLSLDEGEDGMRVAGSETTGFIIIDELIRDGKLTEEEFVAFCESRDIEPADCISVETNFRIGDKVPGMSGLRVSDVGYTAFFNKVQEKGHSPETTTVFASINEATRRSLGAIGIGNELIKPGTAESGEYELVSIPLSPSTSATFKMLGQMVTVKEMIFA